MHPPVHADDPTSLEAARALGTYHREVGFYRDVAPHVSIRSPEFSLTQQASPLWLTSMRA